MRIGIPIWDDKVSPVLDSASRLLIVETEDGNVASRFEIYLDEQDLLRRCFRIRGLEVDTLICGAVSNPFASMLTASGVDVIQEISGHVEEVLKAYLRGNLFNSRFLMPGCKRNRESRKNRSLQFKQSSSQPSKRKKNSQRKTYEASVSGSSEYMPKRGKV